VEKKNILFLVMELNKGLKELYKMKICSNCQKKIWFWNKFNRKYGKGFLISRDFSKILEEVYFCCEDCLFEYKKDYNIDFLCNECQEKINSNNQDITEQEKEQAIKRIEKNMPNNWRLNIG
jgi:hypothetical protein